MIDIKDVTMKFDMGIEKGFSFKQLFINMLDPKLRKSQKKEKSYFLALDDVSFHVERGEVIGLIGSNGAGKSTLLKVVSGVMKPTKGKVVANGSIAPMIELGAGFDAELTARENIYLNGAVLGYSESFIDEHYDEIVEFAEIGDFIDMPLKNYSSGMVSRIAFSIATAVKPDILIADEILAVGDFKFQEKCMKRIRGLMENGATILLVSHSIDQIRSMCDRAMWIEKGETKIIGNTKEVCDAYSMI